MSKQYVNIHGDLENYNSMHIKAKAKRLILPFSATGVCEAIQDYSNDRIIILGKGSNIIFQEEEYSCPIISSLMLCKIYYYSRSIITEAGVSLSQLAWFALEHSVSGYEFLEDIPGSIGGALYMNAGTYEDTIGNLLLSATIYDCVDKEVKELSKEQIASWWGKRESYFQHHPCYIIKATFDAGTMGKYEDILDKMLETKKKRYLKQPREYPSAGSVFKRPYVNGEPRYIWKLFDEAGLRGYRIGDAQVSEKHPGFIVNIGNATGKDIVDLMNYCKHVVFDKYGIRIEEEWKIV